MLQVTVTVQSEAVTWYYHPFQRILTPKRCVAQVEDIFHLDELILAAARQSKSQGIRGLVKWSRT